jgi:hypothetical protein
MILTAPVLALTAQAARADTISSFAFEGVVQYGQTADNAPGTNPTAFFATDINPSNAGDITAAAGTSGATATGQASFNYVSSGVSANYQSGYITPAALSDYMKQGTSFVANVTGGTLAGQRASVAYGPTLFPSAVPYLTGNTYSALQGLNASQGLTLTFNGFTAAAGASFSLSNLYIYNPATGMAYYDENLLPGATSVLLAANTLAAGTTYDLILDYDNTVSTSNAGFGGATFMTVYDNRDFLSFTTATTAASIPEPASLSLMAIGAASILVVRRRRSNPSA